MTPQEIFDKAFHAVVAQGGPCIDPSHGSCSYYLPNGFRCAVGHLVAEETAKLWGDEGVGSVQELVEDHPYLPKPDFIVDNLELLMDIQVAHDFQSQSLACWDFKGNMKGVALKHSLKYPEPEEVVNPE